MRDTPTDEELLKTTRMLDFQAPNIVQLLEQRGWKQLPIDQAARAVYEFCRDEILFGYNAESDDMPASAILSEGLGHCNTKSTLLMALLRAVGVPCRLHGFTIDKLLQKGALTPLAYFLAPQEIIHTWVEAHLGGRWITLEGLILDQAYLHSVQKKFQVCKHPFLGFAVATEDLQKPSVEWTGGDTFIQSKGINRNFGLYNSPDDFYAEHQTNLRGLRRWLYRNIIYKQLNRNVARIRAGEIEGQAGACCS